MSTADFHLLPEALVCHAYRPAHGKLFDTSTPQRTVPKDLLRDILTKQNCASFLIFFPLDGNIMIYPTINVNFFYFGEAIA